MYIERVCRTDWRIRKTPEFRLPAEPAGSPEEQPIRRKRSRVQLLKFCILLLIIHKEKRKGNDMSEVYT